ncbi:hypothetical protein Syun_012396 [Stephania yunnanensis]|uniref:Uncharacterized protein n=1 Tax=Stephania yunnanensis TaxID=152371 RepID=A0AAP0JZK0_9MAGN
MVLSTSIKVFEVSVEVSVKVCLTSMKHNNLLHVLRTSIEVFEVRSKLAEVESTFCNFSTTLELRFAHLNIDKVRPNFREVCRFFKAWSRYLLRRRVRTAQFQFKSSIEGQTFQSWEEPWFH